MNETRYTARRYIKGVEVITSDGIKRHAVTFDSIADEEDADTKLRDWAAAVQKTGQVPANGTEFNKEQVQ